MRKLGRLKKFFAGVLAAAMVFTTGVGVMADTTTGAGTGEGTITVENALKDTDTKYEVYRVFDFVGVESTLTDGKYSNGTYKLSDKWKAFGETEYAKTVFSKNTDDTLTFVESFNSAEAAKTFASEALKFAKEKGIAADLNKGNATATDNGDGKTQKLVFSNVPLGYYLINSSAGVLLSLDTAAKNVTINEKNDVPTIDKQVMDSETGKWGESSDAGIGDTVEFKITVHAMKGVEKKNYVVHDKMSKGLDFGDVASVTAAGKTLTEGTEYTVNRAPADGCTFEVAFDQTFLDTLSDATDIEINYNATINSDAVIAPTGNVNEAKLTYGDDSSTEWDSTNTYVYRFDLHKHAAGVSENLAGAKFMLLKSDKVTIIKLIQNPSMNNVFRVAKAGEAGAVDEFVTVEGKDIVIEGLDIGKYYLEETEAPAGYNKLADPVEVNITRAAASNPANGNYLVNTKDDHIVDIANNTGSLLPSTGGIGTTIFYLIGGLLIIGAFVSFIVRRKMAD